MSSIILQRALRDFLTEALRDRLRISGLHIDGVEVTQAVQYRSAELHLTDPADRGPDNSVRLVANKAARVRVYVRHLPDPLPGVVGRVVLQRRRYGVWTDVGPLAGVGAASVRAEPDPAYRVERGTAGQSLDFVIPAALMRGQLRLRVSVNTPGAAPGSSQTAEDVVDVDASLQQTLRIRGIPVRYAGPDASGAAIDLAAPGLADFQRTAATTLAMYPVSQTPDVSLAGVFTWSEPLLGAIVGGQCPRAWIDLLFWLAIARVVDGNRADALYYGLFPAGLPVGGAAGCGGGDANVGAGAVNDGMTMAHELGHVLGLPHAPCGLGAGDAGNPAYPAYEPYDTPANRSASLGEYGCDVSTGTLYSPRTAVDFMSYCGPRWISLYTMQRLLLHPRLNPTWVSSGRDAGPLVDEEYRGFSLFDRPDPPPPWVGRARRLASDPDPVPVVVVTGLLGPDGIEIRSVLRLVTRPAPGGARIPDSFVELVDANQRRLHRVPLRQLSVQACGGCGCGGTYAADPPTGLVQAILPDTAPGSVLRVVAGDRELWVREAPPEPPAVADLTAEVAGDELVVRWDTRASGPYGVERAVQWSGDAGRTWDALAVKLDGDRAAAPLHVLPCGDVLVRVLVSDGFHGATSEPVAVALPGRPPAVAILWPSRGATVRTDQLVHLAGAATACDGRAVDPAAMEWTLDGQAVGVGPEVWTALAEFDGEHTATLRVRDGAWRAEATVVFRSSCTGAPAYEAPRPPAPGRGGPA